MERAHRPFWYLERRLRIYRYFPCLFQVSGFNISGSCYLTGSLLLIAINTTFSPRPRPTERRQSSTLWHPHSPGRTALCRLVILLVGDRLRALVLPCFPTGNSDCKPIYSLIIFFTLIASLPDTRMGSIVVSSLLKV
jgi:hypothetical protein